MKREEELSEEGCREIASSKKKREEELREQGCRAVAWSKKKEESREQVAKS